MNQWPLTKLGNSGVSVLDCEHRTPARDEQGSCHYVAIPDIKNGRIDLSGARKISEDDWTSWTRRFKPQAGDVAVTRRGRVGDTAVVPGGRRIAMGQNIVLLRSNGQSMDQGFLRWACRSPAWWSEVERHLNVGAIFSSLNVRDFLNFQLPLPPLPEQRAIAEVLGSLDDKIAANDRASGAADAWIRASYEHLAATTQDVQPLGALASNVRDQVDPRRVSATLPYVGLEHVPRRRMWVREFGSAVGVESTKARFKHHDVLFGRLRPYFHKVVVAPSEGICSTDILVIRPKIGFEGLVLAATSSDHAVELANAASTGTRMPRASWKDLEKLNVPWPGHQPAREMSHQITSLSDSMLSMQNESRKLAALRDALLPELVSGRLKVKDAEEQVEEVL